MQVVIMASLNIIKNNKRASKSKTKKYWNWKTNVYKYILSSIKFLNSWLEEDYFL